MSETLKTVLDKYIESQNKVVFREECSTRRQRRLCRCYKKEFNR